MRYAYPYELAPQPEGGFTVTFPDVPEAITQGDTETDAAAMAEDALVTALSFYTDKFRTAAPPIACARPPLGFAATARGSKARPPRCDARRRNFERGAGAPPQHR